MNERIKELSEKANACYLNGYPSGEGGDEAWKNTVLFEKEDLEKFAELLIAKVLDEVADRAYRFERSWSDEMDRPWVELEFGFGRLAKESES